MNSIKLSELLVSRIQMGLSHCPIALDRDWTLADFQIGCAWLEEETIRILAVKNREWLQNIQDLTAWSTSFLEYCSKLDIDVKRYTVPLSLPDISILFSRLVSRAIEESYSDAKNRPNVLSKNTDPDSLKQATEYKSSSVRLGSESAKILKFIQNELLIPIDIVSPDLSGPEALQIIWAHQTPLAEQIPPGILNDKVVCRLVGTGMLYQIQTKIDQTIAAVQSLTADPKTDSSLGRVGV